jgi:ABC-2 type transport system permease protein
MRGGYGHDPLRILSGAVTLREGLLEFVHHIMLGVPNTHFVMLMQMVPLRGAGFETASPRFAAFALIGSVPFVISLVRFRKALRSMA